MSTALWVKEYLREESDELQQGECALLQQAEQLDFESKENIKWFNHQEELKTADEIWFDGDCFLSNESDLLVEAYEKVANGVMSVDFLRRTINEFTTFFGTKKKTELLAMSDRQLLREILWIID